ncbi:MAG: biotin/lipoyl-binding protein, partial [Lachnospiraceae bacterium]
MNGKKLTAVVLLAALSVSTAACGKTEETPEAEVVAVEVQTPRTGELTVDTTYIGTAAPQEQVYVIPKASGTVTETFFEVGDTVQEGDVLFRIDDEAAQLQMASARAAYASAQAGVTAQNGGARELQNFQTEEQMRQMRESLADTDEQIDDLEDDLKDAKNTEKDLQAKLPKAQQALAAAQAAYATAEAAATPRIEAIKLEIARKQEKINELSTVSGNSTEVAALQTEIGILQEQLAAVNQELAGAKAALNKAQNMVTQLQSGIAGASSGKSQLESAIDQIEDGQDTIRDNLSAAEQAYAITQNTVYPQTDAVGSAQLGTASVAINSAQMQLDFCTVKSPISGIVESVSVEKNGMAAAGNPAYIISNKEAMTVTFHVAEKAKNVLAVGDHVTVEREGAEWDGVLTEIGTMTNPQTRLFQVKATVTGAGGSLPNGVSVKVYATTQR